MTKAEDKIGFYSLDYSGSGMLSVKADAIVICTKTSEYEIWERMGEVVIKKKCISKNSGDTDDIAIKVRTNNRIILT